MPYVGRVPSAVPVTADDIPANSIDASKIVNGAIAVADIADDAVTPAKISIMQSTATSNLGLGTGAVDSITTGDYNVGVGDNALTALTSGEKNTAIGFNALTANTTASNNTAVGMRVLDANTTGQNNTGLGADALGANTTASNNTATGYQALYSNTTASNNTATGYQALYSNTTGVDNSILGFQSGYSVTIGSNNTLLGYKAGHYSTALTSGNSNTVIGAYSRPNSAAATNQIVIGVDVIGAGDNNFTFGKLNNRVYNAFNANASWTRSSDERLKKEITTNTDCGLGFINDLRTVTYKWKAPSEIAVGVEGHNVNITQHSHADKMYGFVAQEVKAALDTHNITDFNGWSETSEDQGAIQGISYEMFVMPLVKAVQELSAENKALMTRIEALEA